MTARPILNKIINTIPLYIYYKPYGVPLKKLEEVGLTLEELEAMNLRDKQGILQNDAAKKMGISRSSFQRLLRSARKKMISAIVEGKALKFEGGNYIHGKNITTTPCLKGIYHYKINKSDLKGKEQIYKLSKIKCPVCGKRLVELE